MLLQNGSNPEFLLFVLCITQQTWLGSQSEKCNKNIPAEFWKLSIKNNLLTDNVYMNTLIVQKSIKVRIVFHLSIGARKGSDIYLNIACHTTNEQWRRKLPVGQDQTYVVRVLVRFAFALRLVFAVALVPFGRELFFVAGRLFVAPGGLPPPLLFFALPLFFQFVGIREPATPALVIGPFTWQDKTERYVYSTLSFVFSRRPWTKVHCWQIRDARHIPLGILKTAAGSRRPTRGKRRFSSLQTNLNRLWLFSNFERAISKNDQLTVYTYINLINFFRGENLSKKQYWHQNTFLIKKTRRTIIMKYY